MNGKGRHGGGVEVSIPTLLAKDNLLEQLHDLTCYAMECDVYEEMNVIILILNVITFL